MGNESLCAKNDYGAASEDINATYLPIWLHGVYCASTWQWSLGQHRQARA